MGSSTSPDRKTALQLTSYKPSQSVTYAYLAMRSVFVIGAGAMVVFGLSHLLPLFEQDSQAEAAPAIITLLFWGIAAFMLFAAQPVGPSTASQKRCQSDKVATFSLTSQGWLLCEPTEKFRKSSNKNVLFVFYCAPKLHPTQYASLAKEVAKQGISTLILEPPFGFFFGQPPKAGKVIEAMHPTFTRFVLGGHDMGVHFVCNYAKELSGQNELAGLVLMGALVKNKQVDLSQVRGSDGALPVVLLNGSRDKLITQHIEMRHKGSFKTWVSKAKTFLPEGASIRMIKDGNHFGFSDRALGYLEGFPFVDNTAWTSREQHQKETALVVSQVANCSPSNPLPTSR